MRDILTLTIPDGLQFDDLQPTINNGKLEFDAEVLERVCVVSGYPVEQLENTDFAMSALLRWYELHLRQGGRRSRVMDGVCAGVRWTDCAMVVLPESGCHLMH